MPQQPITARATLVPPRNNSPVWKLRICLGISGCFMDGDISLPSILVCCECKGCLLQVNCFVQPWRRLTEDMWCNTVSVYYVSWNMTETQGHLVSSFDREPKTLAPTQPEECWEQWQGKITDKPSSSSWTEILVDPTSFWEWTTSAFEVIHGGK